MSHREPSWFQCPHCEEAFPAYVETIGNGDFPCPHCEGVLNFGTPSAPPVHQRDDRVAAPPAPPPPPPPISTVTATYRPARRTYRPRHTSFGGLLDFSSRPRTLRHLVHVAILFWWVPFVILMVPIAVLFDGTDPTAAVVGAIVLSVVVFFFYDTWAWSLSRYLTPLIVSGFIKHLRCPGCRERIVLVQQWNCGCGYRDHRAKNLLSHKCPSCKTHCGHTTCPRCQCTILL